MDKINASLIIAVIITGSIVGYMAYTQGYFDFLLPQPKISLIESNSEIEKNTISSFKNGISQDECVNSNVLATFTIINSGDIDGFITVKLLYIDEIIDLNRFFVKANEEQKQNLSSTINSCNVIKQNLTLKISVERS